MISPLQNLQMLIGIEQQLLANLIQNIGSGAEPMQQTASQTGTADNSPSSKLLADRHPPLKPVLSGVEGLNGGDNSPHPPLKIRGGESPEGARGSYSDQTSSLKEQIVSLTQTLVQQGHLPSSTLNQPIPVIVPQMLACLGKLHREEEKKKRKKKKKREDEESEEKHDTPVDALLKQIFRFS